MARADTRFWVVGPEFGLARTENLGTVISGNYIAAQPGSGQTTTTFTGLERPPHDQALESGLNLQLKAARRGSIDSGDPVYYRQVQVGSVIGTRLGNHADEVVVFVNIRPYYAPLVRNNSVFWNVSGIRVDASLVGGMKVDTESIESLLEGGIAFATPDNELMGDTAGQGMAFTLYDQHKPEWLSWSPKIPLGPQP
jgi:paraquat-inducible protein B